MIGRLLDFLFPPVCALCRALLDRDISRRAPLHPLLEAADGFLCRRCNRLEEYLLLSLRETARLCECCGEVLLPDETEKLCEPCREFPPDLDGLRSLFVYAGDIELLIKRYKYGGDRLLGAAFGKLLGTLARLERDIHRLQHIDAIIPLPSAPDSLSRRGFNHVLPLAKEIGRQTGLPVLHSTLQSRGKRSAQALLPPELRIRNMENAFITTESKTGTPRSVLLVDDVITTGASVRSAAQTLRTAGSSRIFCFTLARSRHYTQHRVSSFLSARGD